MANTQIGAAIVATAPSTPSLQVLYSVQNSGNIDPSTGKAIFGIGSCGGNLRVANDDILDYYRKTTWYNVTIRAYVTGLYGSVGAAFASMLVYLTPVVKPPTFAATSLFLFENATAGSRVGSLAAVSREGLPLVYTILSGNSLGLFAIGPNPPLVPSNASSSLLSLAAGANSGPYSGTAKCACGASVVNFESTNAASFVLLVSVYNLGYPTLSTQAFVTVTSLNSNDQPWFVSTPMLSASETAAIPGALISSPPPVYDEDFQWGDFVTWSLLNVSEEVWWLSKSVINIFRPTRWTDCR